MERAAFRVRWTSRLLGLAVLGLAVGAMAVLAVEGGSAVSWTITSTLLVLSGLATVANFGDRVVADDEGLTSETLRLRTFGLARRRARWSEIARAVDQDGDTWFLEVEGQSRWVLDHLDRHEELGALLRERGVGVDARQAPRLWRRGGRPDAA